MLDRGARETTRPPGRGEPTHDARDRERIGLGATRRQHDVARGPARRARDRLAPLLDDRASALPRAMDARRIAEPAILEQRGHGDPC